MWSACRVRLTDWARTLSCSMASTSVGWGKFKVPAGGWSGCGGFSDTCDTTGEMSRTVFTPVCSGGSCTTATSTETEAVVVTR